MPAIRTDDGPRRLRGVWLGPKGLRWPVDWTYVQWGVFILATATLPFVVFGVLLWVNQLLAGFTGILAGPLLAYEITTRLPKWLDYDRPLRHWLRLWRSEYQSSIRVSRLRTSRDRPVLPTCVALSTAGGCLIYRRSLRGRRFREGDMS